MTRERERENLCVECRWKGDSASITLRLTLPLSFSFASRVSLHTYVDEEEEQQEEESESLLLNHLSVRRPSSSSPPVHACVSDVYPFFLSLSLSRSLRKVVQRSF